MDVLNKDSVTPLGFRAAMNKFKAMDKAANPQGAKSGFAPKANPNSPKEIMLRWCQAVTKGYEGVDVKNFGSSWADGLAFCALIHHFYPDSFDFSTLKPENRKENFELAFDTAEIVVIRPKIRGGEAIKSLVSPIVVIYPRHPRMAPEYCCVRIECRRSNICPLDHNEEKFWLTYPPTHRKLGNVAPLLEVSDLLRMKVPDWKCVFTQIQLYYCRFHLEEGKKAHKPPVGILPKAAPPGQQKPATSSSSDTVE